MTPREAYRYGLWCLLAGWLSAGLVDWWAGSRPVWQGPLVGLAVLIGLVLTAAKTVDIRTKRRDR